jgi:hypothetical protein
VLAKGEIASLSGAGDDPQLNEELRMQNEKTFLWRLRACRQFFILHSSFFISGRRCRRM